ncbi:hypothetical protein A0O34_20660 [Chryseobacterium glaciei]|uniref:Uncharacterized protein n=1 Tax=Chryseobacterium glaciei TaxID=1685010 RepID=A0A172Y0H4_9FLAO|nr:hypothetical protein [Chryseobacterium glaciei]ANF52777.1 hypothetical protein A0O34_20660 [Chryseobacterium glaciei]
MKLISDLIKKPTFISIVSILLFVLGLPLIIYQFFTLDSSSSLGIAIEIIILMFVLGLLIIDRFLVKKVNTIRLSIIEIVLIGGYLMYYYFTNNNSFSIG